MKADIEKTIQNLEIIKAWAKNEGRFIEESFIQQQIDCLKRVLELCP